MNKQGISIIESMAALGILATGILGTAYIQRTVSTQKLLLKNANDNQLLMDTLVATLQNPIACQSAFKSMDAPPVSPSVTTPGRNGDSPGINGNGQYQQGNSQYQPPRPTPPPQTPGSSPNSPTSPASFALPALGLRAGSQFQSLTINSISWTNVVPLNLTTAYLYDTASNKLQSVTPYIATIQITTQPTQTNGIDPRAYQRTRFATVSYGVRNGAIVGCLANVTEAGVACSALGGSLNGDKCQPDTISLCQQMNGTMNGTKCQLQAAVAGPPPPPPPPSGPLPPQPCPAGSFWSYNTCLPDCSNVSSIVWLGANPTGPGTIGGRFNVMTFQFSNIQVYLCAPQSPLPPAPPSGPQGTWRDVCCGNAGNQGCVQIGGTLTSGNSSSDPGFYNFQPSCSTYGAGVQQWHWWTPAGSSTPQGPQIR